ncbi:MAG: hypothetical protein SVK44_02890 [Nitrospirota bacterium]|nr:hypothetical protein [Nitrospirota bacterium]
MVKKTKVRGPEKAIPVIDLAPLSAPLSAKTGKTGGGQAYGAPMGGQAYF